jgi:hypothetical protein
MRLESYQRFNDGESSDPGFEVVASLGLYVRYMLPANVAPLSIVWNLVKDSKTDGK